MSAQRSLLAEVQSLATATFEAYRGSEHEPEIQAVIDRLREPLRVAIAGRVKAGKSTLLNALVGQELAATDAGEMTRVVTWYRDGIAYQATLFPKEGAPLQVPMSSNGGPVGADLQGFRAEEVDRIIVDWPSASLKEMTLIDTPGIASLTAEASQRTHDFLTPGEDQPTAADAVLYLMRHVHSSDIHFLEAFHDEEVSQATPINAIGVLSRADEIGVGRLDSMTSASRIAQRYRTEPRLRRLCQTVIPVAALIAQTGATLREDEFQALAKMAAAPKEVVGPLLISADRFVRADDAIGVDEDTRTRLLRRLGLFGVRVSLALLQQRAVAKASDLSEQLVRRSGLMELRRAVVTQLASRRDALKSRSALLAIERLLHRAPGAGADRLASELERVYAGAHAFAELRLMNALRAGGLKLTEQEAAQAERLLGAEGGEPATRLGLAPDASPQDLRMAAGTAIARWQQRAESPMSDRNVVEAARVLVRSCEGILAGLS